VAFYTKDRAFNTKKMREKLAYSYAYTNETGLRQTAQWYKDQGWIKG
jgi:dTDP-D-glucose 4,6-dehydratase